ncbi:hypothetical protein KY285_007590 [Solanum tuberosum]|nr:hypothetical protein KY284_007666 [Solanum tuberosum]KAH0745933.1 hypothetical protein KY285_007590 [Solanum tuberosum]
MPTMKTTVKMKRMNMSPDEKKGGKPHRMEKGWDFISCINDCGMVDVGYKGLRFTWCNDRKRSKKIWKRLDRTFINQHWTDSFSIIDIEHLPSTVFDQTPMIMKYSTSEHPKIMYFKFLNFWIDQPNFKDVVQEAWNEDVDGNSMRRLHLKMKNVSHKLSLWSRKHIGNVFDKVKEWEAKMLDLETDYIENDNDDLRPQIHKTQAEHTRWLKCEQSILRQRANIRWLEDGDSNTKYFHNVINEKRRRATIHRIQSENGQWITGNDQIAKETVDYFSKLFSDDQEIELHHLDCIDQRVHRDDNNMLEAIPNEAEIKEAVFGLKPDSTPRPDGFGGAFYQSCWDIIKSDLIDVIQ